MTLLYAKDIQKRSKINVLGTPFLYSNNEAETLDDIKKNIDDRIKYGFEIFHLDNEGAEIVKKSIEDIRSKAKTKLSQTETYKPLISALKDALTSGKEKNINEPSERVDVEPQVGSVHNPSELRTQFEGSTRTTTHRNPPNISGAVSAIGGESMLKMPQISNILNRIKNNNMKQMKRGGGLIEL